MLMTPIVVHTRKEIVPGHHQHITRLQSFIQLQAGNRQVLKPQPEKHSSFGFMHSPRHITHCSLQTVNGKSSPVLIVRTNHLFTQPIDAVIADHLQCQQAPDAVGRQIHNRINARQRPYNWFTGHDNACAYRWQTKLRQAQAENRVFVPMRRGLSKNQFGKRSTVGTINNQRNVVLPGQAIKPGHLLIGQHIAGGVGGARYTQCSHTVVNNQLLEIDPVLKCVLIEMLNIGFVGDKEIVTQAAIGVANVLWCHG